MATKIYSHQLRNKIESQLPDRVLNELSICGWNAFGIYGLVRDEIKRERKDIKNKKLLNDDH